MNGKENEEEDVIVEVLPSGVKMVLIGTPSVENCKDFIKILLKASRKAMESEKD